MPRGRPSICRARAWGLSFKDIAAHPFEADLRLVASDGKEAEIDVHLREPGKDGSLRGRVRARICPGD